MPLHKIRVGIATAFPETVEYAIEDDNINYADGEDDCYVRWGWTTNYAVDDKPVHAAELLCKAFPGICFVLLGQDAAPLREVDVFIDQIALAGLYWKWYCRVVDSGNPQLTPQHAHVNFRSAMVTARVRGEKNLKRELRNMLGIYNVDE